MGRNLPGTSMPLKAAKGASQRTFDFDCGVCDQSTGDVGRQVEKRLESPTSR